MPGAGPVTLAALVCLSAVLCALPVPPKPGQPADPLLSDAVPHGRVPIAVLHMYDSVSFFQRLGKLTGENKARYAARHGYDIVHSTPLKTSGVLKPASCEGRLPDSAGRCWEEDKNFDIDHSRAPTFGKIKLSLAACRGRDNGWLLWMDADAMIVNQSVPLESLIDDGYDLMLAYDWLMLNAGMLLMKCSDWMKSFLQRVYDARKFDEARALDQSSFQEHLDNLTATERDAHVKVVPKYAMNVYTEEYRPGDFLMHMAGKLYEATEPGLFAIANQFDILSMVDDIEDVRAFFRSTRLLNYYSGTCKLNTGQRQADCKSVDPRRILLNESLGSMSYPNRYRHVGLRYYWLGNWKDKYDVPGWNVKKKALPMPETAPPGKEMPPVPLAALHHDLRIDADAGQGARAAEAGSSRGQAHGDVANRNHAAVHDDEKPKQDAPEVEHDVDVKMDGKDVVLKADDDDDDDEASSWPMWLRVLVLGFCTAAVCGLVVALRKRKQKISKIQ